MSTPLDFRRLLPGVARFGGKIEVCSILIAEGAGAALSAERHAAETDLYRGVAFKTGRTEAELRAAYEVISADISPWSADFGQGSAHMEILSLKEREAEHDATTHGQPAAG